MVGPLWGFFQLVRSSGHIPLSIDQYFFFVHALHSEAFRTVSTKADLLALMKIFWLNEPGFEPQFNALFNRFFDDKVLWKILPDQKTENEAGDDGHDHGQQEKTSGPEAPAPDPSANDDLKKDPGKKADHTQDARSEIELILKDSTAGEGKEAPFKRELAHAFALSDKSIMPFDARKFAQRLRRKVETAEQVSSDRINAPEMVRQFVELGFIEEIIYELEDASYSNIVLFSDRFGSMLAYEYLDMQFRDSLRNIPHCTFEHYAFYNLPVSSEDRRGFLFTPADAKGGEISSDRHPWTRNTWFFILSDAGGHSGTVNRQRIIRTNQFWTFLTGISEFVYWINPIPAAYLNDCTAKRLQMKIPMITPEMANLNQLVKEARTVR